MSSPVRSRWITQPLTFHRVTYHGKLEIGQFLETFCLTKVIVFFCGPVSVIICLIVKSNYWPASRRWSSRFTIPEPLQEGSNRLQSITCAPSSWKPEPLTYMWVTERYFGSVGFTVRKSIFTGSTFAHLAFESINFKVENRFWSLSKANNCTAVNHFGLKLVESCVPFPYFASVRSSVKSYSRALR